MEKKEYKIAVFADVHGELFEMLEGSSTHKAYLAIEPDSVQFLGTYTGAVVPPVKKEEFIDFDEIVKIYNNCRYFPKTALIEKIQELK